MDENLTRRRIADRRKQLDLTQAELADLMGYKDKTSITNIESGKSGIPYKRIKQFAEVLGTTVAYLTGVDDEAEQEDGIFPSVDPVLFLALGDVDSLFGNPRVQAILYLLTTASDEQMDQYIKIIAAMQEEPIPDMDAILERLHKKIGRLRRE